MVRIRNSWWVVYIEPLLGILACIVLLATLNVINRVADATTTPNDFSVFLSSARWLRQGADLYQRPLRDGPGYNLNTPPWTLVFVAFSFLSDGAAFRLWTALAIAAYLLAAFWIARAAWPGRMVTIAAAIFVSAPAITSFLLGQTTALLMLLLTAAWLADKQDRPWRAGSMLGIAIAAKPFLGVFFGYAVWRRSRALFAGLCAGVAATGILGLLVAGVSGYRSWMAALGQISWTAHGLNGSLLGLLTRTMSVTPDVLQMTPTFVRPELVRPLWWAAVAIVVAAGTRALLLTRDLDRAWALMLVGSLLLSPLGWMYYVPLATGPLLTVARRSSFWTRGVLAVGGACLLVPPLPVQLSAVGTLTLGSVYNWALLLLFFGVWGAQASRDRETEDSIRSQIHRATVAQK